MSAHSIVEVYAVLTRLPVQPRIHPAEAVRIITDKHCAAFRGRTHREKGLPRGAQSHWKWRMERSEDLRCVAHGRRGQVGCRSDLHSQPRGFPAAGFRRAAGKSMHAVKSECLDQGGQGFHRSRFARTELSEMKYGAIKVNWRRCGESSNGYLPLQPKGGDLWHSTKKTRLTFSGSKMQWSISDKAARSPNRPSVRRLCVLIS